MKLVVTVDTEADNQWKIGAPQTIGNVFALPEFQGLCERYGVPPTYLATYEVVSDARASEMLAAWQARGVAEVGAHLHPWTTPPFSDKEQGQAFPSELSDASLRAKFAELTKCIEGAIGRPTSYRAGRWGFDRRQADLLREFGYVVDSSVTPLVSWADSKGLEGGVGGPDFTHERAMPYALNDSVLELPMTIMPLGLLRRPRWLRIFRNTTRERLTAVVREAVRRELPAVVFMIHSSELVANASPYVPDEQARAAVYQRLKELFSFCASQGIEPTTLTGFARTYRASTSPSA